MSAEVCGARDTATGRHGCRPAVSDRSFFDTFKEAGSMGKHLAEARKSSESPLVQCLAEGHGTGIGLTSSKDDVESGTLESLGTAAALLRQKAPEEFEAHRAFVLDLARSVSSAAGGGDEAESEAIAKIEALLA